MFQYTLAWDVDFIATGRRVYTWFDIYPRTKCTNLKFIAGDVLKERLGGEHLSYDKGYFSSVSDALASITHPTIKDESAWLSHLAKPPLNGGERYILKPSS